MKNSVLVARFKPLHLGSGLMLDAVCSNYDFAYIGIGSSNRELSATNPFTAEESKEMVDLFMEETGHGNYETFFMPDYAHLGPQHRDGQAWKEHLQSVLGTYSIDDFVTGNPWVSKLLGTDYRIVHPSSLVEARYQVPLKASKVRIAIANSEDWQRLVPGCIADYISKNSLDQRLRSRFGTEILATQNSSSDSLSEEQSKIYR